MPTKKVKAPKVPKDGSARRITRNTLFLGLSEAGARLSTWGLVAFLGRVWPVALYGQYAVAVNWVSIFAVLGEVGLNALTVREVAHKPGRASFFLRHVLVIRGTLSLFFWAALIVLSWILHYETILTLAIAVMGLRLILDSLEGGYIYLFQAHQEMAPYALVNLLCAGVRLVGIILVVLAGAQLVGAGSIWTLASGVGFLSLMALGYRRGWRADLASYRVEDSWKVLRLAVPLATFGALQTLYYRVDSVLLKSLSGNEAVGYYDMASRVLFVVLAVSQLYSQALYPAFASLKDKPKDFSRLAFQGGRVLFLLGLPISVGGYFLADPILRLVGGPQYLPAGPAFAVLALSTLPFFLSMIYTDVLAVKDNKRLNLQFAILFVLNVGLNLFFIPRWGYVGAAWATVICEYLGVATGFFLAAPYLDRPKDLGPFKTLVAAIPPAVFLGFGTFFWPSLAWILIGPPVYGFGLWWSGGIDPDEKKKIFGWIKKKTS